MTDTSTTRVNYCYSIDSLETPEAGRCPNPASGRPSQDPEHGQ